MPNRTKQDSDGIERLHFKNLAKGIPSATNQPPHSLDKELLCFHPRACFLRNDQEMRGRARMLTVYKFRLYPTKTQANLMGETIETCRRLYNALLSDRIENGNGFYEQKRPLASMKSNSKFLRAAHSQVLQDVALRLDKAFGSFFAGLADTQNSNAKASTPPSPILSMADSK